MKTPPQLLIISTTLGCNLKCTHCSVAAGPRRPEELTLEELTTCLAGAYHMGIRRLRITGGEPFIRADMIKLIERCVALGFFVTIETNGTLLSEKKLERLIRLKPSIQIAVSLDGFSAETHDTFRGVKGSFDKTFSFIERLSRLEMMFGVLTVLNRLNQAETPDLIRYCLEELNVKHRLLSSILTMGRGADGRYTLTPKEILDFLNSTYFPLIRYYQQFLPEEQFGVDIGQALIPSDIKMSSGCGWVSGMVGMTSVGDMGLCHDIYDLPAFIAGNVRKDSIHHIWNTSPVFAKLRGIKPTQLRGICGNCRFNKSCRGKCRVHAVQYFGDIYAPDPVCQEYYNQGLFPQEALIDPERPSTFG